MTSRKKAPITNYARHVYEKFFDKSRRLMNESGQDLSQFLSTFMPSDSETILMKPPDRLKKKKKEREVWCKERFREYYYEWIINNALLGHTKKYGEGLKSHREGGEVRSIQKTLERIEREEIIIQTEKKLIIDGVKKPTNLRIAQEIPGENEGYVQKFRAKRKKEKKSLLAS